ncbi:potassium/proton antiporter [Actinoplanes subtropicus]|uniref:potassium/proton antiporter n=1 Tax=Actinoplanes subtropicus TaxID=543632 RepID=UPI0004C3D00F|nr:potassium/proton antiporter [Actinoplanes subtropicus]
MKDVASFGWDVLGVSLVVVAAILSNRVSDRIRIPAPALFLVGAAIAADLFPALASMRVQTVQNVVTVALIMILFNGGMGIGWRHLRPNAGAVLWIGVAGTAVTAAGLAVFAHAVLGFGWQVALLLGTALSPTDPAVVFSVLGRREIVGRSGVLLEGEAGANDPVGIALMAVLVGTVGLSGGHAVVEGLVEFLRQMAIGGVAGVASGWLLLRLMRRMALPSEALYPIRTLAFAGAVYGLATVAGGSGFLAVFIAGIVVGDANAPYKREIERFHSALASLAEVVAFVVLGLTVSLRDLPTVHALWPGLVIAVVLTLLVRPVLVGLISLPVRLRTGERVFVLWAGLKGAVPVLLGTFAFTAGVPDAQRIYEIVFVVVTFSVIVQGGLAPTVAKWAKVPMRSTELEPWALGMRFREEPTGLRRYRVATGSTADGSSIAELPLGESLWISMINRDGRLVQVAHDTVLRAGDEILALADTDGNGRDPGAIFTAPGD